MATVSILPDGYRLRSGDRKDLYLLIDFLENTYRELFPGQSQLAHLTHTVKAYFSPETPLWFVDKEIDRTVACLWMGKAVDQSNGAQYGHIFLVYVKPSDRHQGLATALLNEAKMWSESKGQTQLGLQVFIANQPALNLYEKLGFQTQSVLMVKRL
ncbi:MAG: hypothetical protein N5P05_001893 [Chroococcopsis gigantea SAG 12.99]|nr:GNAT family N-acetyltransferase [Chlorogloea purpurea SAG 13.99]MDV3000287.1 hypothetical protein [Chroococcopsis gigantea SAG 12.99]